MPLYPETCRTIRTEYSSVCSGYARSDAAVRSFTAGASSFIRNTRQAGLSPRGQVPSLAFLSLGHTNSRGNTNANSKRGLASSSGSGGSKTAVVMGLEVGSVYHVADALPTTAGNGY